MFGLRSSRRRPRLVLAMAIECVGAVVAAECPVAEGARGPAPESGRGAKGVMGVYREKT